MNEQSLRWAKLNHTLVPDSKDGRDRLRRSRLGRFVFNPLFNLFETLTPWGRAAIMVWMVAGAFGIHLDTRQVYLLWCLLTGFIVASLVLGYRARLRDVELRAVWPERVGRDEAFSVDLLLNNHGKDDHGVLLTQGPLLPWDGRYVNPSPTGEPLEAGGRQTLSVDFVFSSRGRHQLDPISVAARMPLGLTVGPRLRTGAIEFVVVPKIARITRVRTPTVAKFQVGGVALASLTGESREVMGLRPYRPGDPIRDLAPRAWARYGAPVVREYQQEYFTRLGVVVDTSVTKESELRFESVLSLAAGMVQCLTRGEALVDLLVLGDSPHKLTLGRSLGRMTQVLDLLADAETVATPFEPEATMRRMRPHLSGLSCVLFVSLSAGPAQVQFTRALSKQVAVRAFWVAPPETEVGSFTRVDPDAIESLQAIAL